MATLDEILNPILANPPELIGTERQIAWAEQIADKAMDLVVMACKNERDAWRAGDTSQETFQRTVTRAVQLLRETRAAWWIEHRDQVSTLENVVELLCNAPKGAWK